MNEKLNYNIEDTASLMTRSKGPKRRLMVILIIIAALAVLMIGILGVRSVKEKRYNAQIEIADKAFVEGDYQMAENAYLKAVNMNKRKPKARENLAYTYAVQQKTDDAARVYDELFKDTKETKYKEASEEVQKGFVPTNPDIAPAKGRWREINFDVIPYKETLNNYIVQMTYDCFSYISGTGMGKEASFDYKKPDGFFVLPVVLAGGCPYGISIEDQIKKMEGDEPEITERDFEMKEGRDPKAWINNNAVTKQSEKQYLVYDVTKADWIMKNIFNLNDQDIEAMVKKGEEEKRLYKEGDKYYYFSGWAEGYPDPAAKIKTVWTDAEKYCIEYDTGSDDGSGFVIDEENPTRYMIMAPKSLEDKHYWSIYYNGTEMPSEVKGIAKNQSEDKEKEANNNPEPTPEPEPEPEQDWRKTLVPPSNTTDQAYHGYVSSPEGLNLRYGPGEEYDVIEVLPNNAGAEEYGWTDSGEWIYVHYNGRYGWINAQYFMMEGGRAKPVIYLYPTKTTDVRVKLTITDGKLTRTIPADNNGVWNVSATPKGKLTDKSSGKEYEYIFWESTGRDEYDWSRGYVVAGHEARDFLKRILPKLGLNKKESDDFTEYWLPRLEKNKYNLVTFQTECYTNAAELEVYPKPDSILRVFMAYKPIDKPVSIPKPIIMPFERRGFAVVEWGGTEIK